MTNILVVDDSTFARNNLRRTLENAGFCVTEANSGMAAIQEVEKLQPDLVTLDLLMPEMDGLETLGKLRGLCPGTKFLIVTADVQKTTRQELLSAGAHAFINKPVTRQALLAAVTEMLGQPQQD